MDDYGKSSAWWTSFGVLLMLTFATRFYQLDQPAWVCWDETHFGKMGSWLATITLTTTFLIMLIHL